MPRTLLALAQAFSNGDDGVVPGLLATFAKAAAPGGKENCTGKELREAALLCFKAVQQRLAQPGAAHDVQLIALGRASLAAVAATGSASAGSAAAAQLQGWRYNFARRLVSCKAFEDARQEAWMLYQQMGPPRACGAADATAVASAQLAVGTALTLLLCCVEGGLLADDLAVAGMLQAVGGLAPWLRWVPG